MKNPQPMNKSRTLLLLAVMIATTLALGKSLVHPITKSPHFTDFIFPESVPLKQWKLLTSDSINTHSFESPEHPSGNFVSGRYYRYGQNQKFLDIEMRYLINTNGDLKSFITHKTGELVSVLREDPNRGFYSVFSHDGKVYLSACINSRGGSTITSDQFNRNRMIYDARLDRLVLWFLGQAKLKDRRCLWANLSLPLDHHSSTEETYRTLETVWYDWYNWWKSFFPNP